MSFFDFSMWVQTVRVRGALASSLVFVCAGTAFAGGVFVGCDSSGDDGPNTDGSAGAVTGGSGTGATNGTGSTSSSGGASGGQSSGGGGGADDSCRTTAECDQGYCIEPGGDAGCGICFEPEETCETDDECSEVGDTHICVVARCNCGEAKSCEPGCSGDEQCADGEECAEDHHCRALACDESSPCPADFDCDDGACARRACEDDGACDGVCVNGACHATEGTCQLPPP